MVFKNGIYRVAELSLTSAQILALFTTPIEIIPAQGSGTQIIPLVGIIKYTHVTTAYATNVTLGGIFTGAGQLTFNNAVILTSTVSRTGNFTFVANSGASTRQYIENVPLTITVTNGNPTAGDGTIKIKLPYFVHKM
jgi:hypothetical protein